MKQKKTGMSRRDFSRNLALIAATAAMPAGAALAKESSPPIVNRSSVARQTDSAQEADATKLTPEGEAQYQMVLSRYGSRLSDEQKAYAKRLVASAQQTGKTMESFKLENWNEPAPIFKVYTSDKSPESSHKEGK